MATTATGCVGAETGARSGFVTVTSLGSPRLVLHGIPVIIPCNNEGRPNLLHAKTTEAQEGLAE